MRIWYHANFYFNGLKPRLRYLGKLVRMQIGNNKIQQLLILSLVFQKRTMCRPVTTSCTPRTVRAAPPCSSNTTSPLGSRQRQISSLPRPYFSTPSFVINTFIIKPIFNCNAKPHALVPHVGLDLQSNDFALPIPTYILVSEKPGVPNASANQPSEY